MKKLFLFPLSLVFLTACDKDHPPKEGNLKLNINGLEDLGPTARYEGWLIANGQPVSTGIFSVNNNGKLSQTVFKVPDLVLNSATTFVLTVEPYPDNDPAPSDVHLLGGDFSHGNKTAPVAVSHPAALGNDFSTAAGKFILATPTDGPDTNEDSGIWFLSLAGGSPAQGLTLPVLPAGWKYEGWAVINGKPVTTGTFLSADMADESGIFSGPLAAPPFPGEDFLVNAPSGLTFPTTLKGGTAIISIEPVPDNSPAPFLLKPLAAGIPANAAVHTDLMLEQNLVSFPAGTVHKTN